MIEDVETLEQAPRLANGVELLGEYSGSGFKEPRYLARRPDSRIVQLSRLLYFVLAAVDGYRSYKDVAAVVTARAGVNLPAEAVRKLVESKLRPGQLVAGAPDLRHLDAAPRLLLSLRGRRTLLPARVVNKLADAPARLFWPPVVLVILALGATLEVRFFLSGSATSSMRHVLARPDYAIEVIGIVLASTLFHELGHAAACRYGGARAGAIGCGLYLVWPAFFTNVTDAYRLPRAGRLRTDLGGIYFNLVSIVPLLLLSEVTRSIPLQAAVILINITILSQLLPFIRFDGYFIVADLVGVPDLFKRVGPVLWSVWHRELHANARPLTRRAFRLIAIWTLAALTFIWANLLWLLVRLPQFFLGTGQAASAAGAGLVSSIGRLDVLRAAYGAVSFVLLVLPVAGLVLILVISGRRATQSLWRRAAGSRSRRAMVIAGSAAGLAALIAIWSGGGYLELHTPPPQSGVATASRPQPLPMRPQPAGAAPVPIADGGGARIVGVDSTRPPDVAVTVSVPEDTSTIPAAAFRLWEDGQPQPVRVTQVPNDALRVCLVVDSSTPASPLDLARLQSAAAELLIRLPMGAQAAVVSSTGAAPHVIQPFTDDRTQLISALSGLSPGGGGVDGALSLAATQLLGANEGRLAVVLITSTAGPSGAEQELVQRFGETNTAWYLVRPISADQSSGNPIPAELVTANGTAISRSNETGLINTLDAVSADLLSQYQLTYKGTQAGARHLRIAVSAGALQAETSATVVVHPPGYPVPGALSQRSRPTSSGHNLLGWIVLAALAVIALSGLIFFRTRLTTAASNVAAVWVRSRPGDHIREYSKWVGRRGTPKRAKWTAAESTEGPAGPNPPLAEPTSHTPASSPAAASPAVGVAITATGSGDIPPAADRENTQAPQPRPKRPPSTGATPGAEHLDAATTGVLAELSETAAAAAAAAATLATTAAPAAAAAAAAALAAAAGSNSVEVRGSGDADMAQYSRR